MTLALMSDPQIVAAVIAVVGAILAALVAAVVKLTLGLTAEVRKVRHEVTPDGGNSAYDHMRGELGSKLDNVARDMRGLRSDIGQLHATDRELRAAIVAVGAERAAALLRHEQNYHSRRD